MAPLATPEVDERIDLAESPSHPATWQTVVWNDPVNLMSYVAHVFRQYFGFSAEKAHRLMLDVHERGQAVVAEGPREQMELHAQAMHDFGLWATVREVPT
jgi:ATP-dependent Clp protease adaptor protein ClpS